MKCKVCGAECGKYVLCYNCNEKKKQGLIIKCPKCNQWHYVNAACSQSSTDIYLYEPKSSLISENEQIYFQIIKEHLPSNFLVFPQINLAAFIEKTENKHFRTELFRNVDFLITDNRYAPKLAIEINDSTHTQNNRKKRDKKVHDILEEAGIHLFIIWSSSSPNANHIASEINRLLTTPFERIRHFEHQKEKTTPPTIPSSESEKPSTNAPTPIPQPTKKKGCYIATCVYGSYDCPQVWTLRRYRDRFLSASWYGRLFIRLYYALSPTVVKVFGKSKIFQSFWKRFLDHKINKLQSKGYPSSPYKD